MAVDSGKGLPIERAIKYPEDHRSAIVKLGYVLDAHLLRLVSTVEACLVSSDSVWRFRFYGSTGSIVAEF
jgi:hypothetical protein